ncbi:MAG: hypothetical protein HXY34_09250 [Candidatus Thorarchaeota archaeon]|nr:hypothetical protein [Candidatus Thorarchaeota archaeon]
MSQEYNVSIGEKTLKADVRRLDEGGVLIVRVGDQSFTLKPTPDKDGVVFVNDGVTDHRVKVLRRQGTNVHVELNGESKNVVVERVPKTVDSRAVVSSASSRSKRVAGGVYPPMPGKITEVRVKVGDSVESGATVCILEAMKMFNELKAPKSGRVKELNVRPGSAVTPDDLLVLVE